MDTVHTRSHRTNFHLFNDLSLHALRLKCAKHFCSAIMLLCQTLNFLIEYCEPVNKFGDTGRDSRLDIANQSTTMLHFCCVFRQRQSIRRSPLFYFLFYLMEHLSSLRQCLHEQVIVYCDRTTCSVNSKSSFKEFLPFFWFSCILRWVTYFNGVILCRLLLLIKFNNFSLLIHRKSNGCYNDEAQTGKIHNPNIHSGAIACILHCENQRLELPILGHRSSSSNAIT
mmetsp:Transcript_26492/g.43749  ORF Transcript_26492/g.43749 Transcript_26492/m.43749 type:complete len:226 (+) Transcript_26492:3742-4419(+)